MRQPTGGISGAGGRDDAAYRPKKRALDRLLSGKAFDRAVLVGTGHRFRDSNAESDEPTTYGPPLTPECEKADRIGSRGDLSALGLERPRYVRQRITPAIRPARSFSARYEVRISRCMAVHKPDV